MTEPREDANLRARNGATIAALLMLAQQVGAKTVRDAFFLSHFGASELPKVMIAAAVLSIAGALLVSKGLSRFGPARVVPAICLINATLFIGEWLAVTRAAPLIAVVLYLHVNVVGSVAISGFWSIVNERFDPHTAKRYVSRIGAGAALGGLVGGFVADRVTSHFELTAMFLVLAGLGVLSSAAMRSIGGSPTPGAKATEAAAAGVRSLTARPYLRNIAALVTLTSLAAAFVDYALKAEAARALTEPGQLASFFALFYALLGAATFLLQTTLSGRALQKLGLGGTIAILPGAMIVGGVLGAALTRLFTAVLVDAIDSVLRSSLFRSGYELLYTPVAPREKRATKTIIDVACDRIGDIFGAGLTLLVLLWIPLQASTAVLVLAVAASTGALVLSLRLHRGYIAELAASLRTGTITLVESDVIDATTRRTLSDTTMALDRASLLAQIQKLREQDRAERDGDGKEGSTEEPSPARDAIERHPLFGPLETLLSSNPMKVRATLEQPDLDPRLLAFIVPLLARQDVARSAVAALSRFGQHSVGQLVDALLDPKQPLSVRRRIPEVLVGCKNDRASAGLLSALEDADFELRFYSAQALLRIVKEKPDLAPRKELVMALAQREVDVAPETWARQRVPDPKREVPASGRRSRSRAEASLEHVLALFGLVLEREPLELCLKAIEAGDPALRATALEYLENVIPEAVYQRLQQKLGEAPPRAVKPARRDDREIVSELRTSMASFSIDREALRAREATPSR